MALKPKNGAEKSSFEDKVGQLKDYILDLLGRKKRRVEETKEEVKEEVEEIMTEPEKRSWFDTFSDLIPGNSTDNSQGGGENTPDDGASQSPQDKYEVHTEDQDEYIPQDMEMGEALGEQTRFAEISPVLKGYYTSGKKSYFDAHSNLWSKRKRLEDFSNQVDTSGKPYTYAGIVENGLTAIPLPEGYLPDITTLHYDGKFPPVLKKDQNNCLYLQSSEKQHISFRFYGGQNIATHGPMPEDSEKIIFSRLSKDTRRLVSQIGGLSPLQKAQKIKQHILATKKYSTKQQGSLRNKSNSKNYIANLDASPVLECFSASALFVGLCRELGVPARVVVGHMTREVDKGKSLLSSNNGHAWSEVWDQDSNSWVQIDATPTQQEDGNKSDQNMQEDNNDSGDQSGEGEGSGEQGGESGQGESSGDGTQSGESGEQGESSGEGNQGDSGEGDQESGDDSGLSPAEALDELIEMAKEDSMANQAEEMKDTLDKLENAETKEDIRDILDSSELSDYAKDAIDEIGNDEILEQEKSEIQNMDDEADVENALNNSLLDDDFKHKLSEYAEAVKDKIQREKEKQKSKMERMGFKEHEMHLYKMYIELEAEVEGEVRSQIRALERILPKNYRTVQDRQNYYKSGPQIGSMGRLIEHTITGDPHVFRRTKEVRESNEINMFETIIIDRSGSMGDFGNPNSPMRASVKAAIIRAKVLEHFKVEFSILFFDDVVEEVMSFGEVYSDKRLNTVPARLMRALQVSGGTNIGEPLAYTFGKMEEYRRRSGKRSFGNISFIGDGQPMSGLMGAGLTAFIEEIRSKGYGLTAYYIDGSGQDRGALQGYFGTESSGGTVLVSDIGQLTEKMIGSYNTGLRNIIRRYAT